MIDFQIKGKIFSEFIELIYIDGTVLSCKIICSRNKMHSMVASEDRDMIGDCVMCLPDSTRWSSDESHQEIVIAIADLGLFLKMLSVLDLDDTLTIKIHTKGNKGLRIEIISTNHHINFPLAEPSIIRNTPSITQQPEFVIKGEFNTQILNKIRKSQSALPEERFHIGYDDLVNQLSIVIGDTDSISNRISLRFTAEECKIETDTDCPDTPYSQEVIKKLIPNINNFDVIKFMLSKEGIMMIVVETKDMMCNYYLIQSQQI